LKSLKLQHHFRHDAKHTKNAEKGSLKYEGLVPLVPYYTARARVSLDMCFLREVQQQILKTRCRDVGKNVKMPPK